MAVLSYDMIASSLQLKAGFLRERLEAIIV